MKVNGKTVADSRFMTSAIGRFIGLFEYEFTEKPAFAFAHHALVPLYCRQVGEFRQPASDMVLGFAFAEHDMTCLRDRDKRDVVAAELTQPPAIFDRHDLVLLDPARSLSSGALSRDPLAPPSPTRGEGKEKFTVP
jgi:hypothetical protein